MHLGAAFSMAAGGIALNWLGGLPAYQTISNSGTLGFTAGGILALLIATHLSICSCVTSSAPYRYAFVSKHNALLPLATTAVIANLQLRYAT